MSDRDIVRRSKKEYRMAEAESSTEREGQSAGQDDIFSAMSDKQEEIQNDCSNSSREWSSSSSISTERVDYSRSSDSLNLIWSSICNARMSRLFKSKMLAG